MPGLQDILQGDLLEHTTRNLEVKTKGLTWVSVDYIETYIAVYIGLCASRALDIWSLSGARPNCAPSRAPVPMTSVG